MTHNTFYILAAILIIAGVATAAATNHPGIAAAVTFIGVVFGGIGMGMDPAVGD